MTFFTIKPSKTRRQNARGGLFGKVKLVTEFLKKHRTLISTLYILLTRFLHLLNFFTDIDLF